MTNEGVKKLIGKLMSDDTFKEQFLKDPAATIHNSGYDIDEEEAKALSKLKPEDIKFEVTKSQERGFSEGSVTVQGISKFN